MRETVAEFRNPVLLYSIGKDSSVMLHLAKKAFFPSRLPLPLLHIDTGWKFRDMLQFRDELARRDSLRLIVHTNARGQTEGLSPFAQNTSYYTYVMKTE